MRFAERWARLMEGRMANGDTLEACADEASSLADNEGITGFMYGCAVSILSQVWIHGEQLRRWHNLETRIGQRGREGQQERWRAQPRASVYRLTANEVPSTIGLLADTSSAWSPFFDFS